MSWFPVPEVNRVTSSYTHAVVEVVWELRAGQEANTDANDGYHEGSEKDS